MDGSTEKFSKIWDRMSGFVRHLSRNHSRDNWLLNSDDLEGELYLHMYKVFSRYEDKPEDEICLLIKTSLRNAIKSLYRKIYQTSRNHELKSFEIDAGYDYDDNSPIDLIAEMDPAEVVLRAELFASRIERLCIFDKMVFDCLIGDNPTIGRMLQLRSSYPRMYFGKENTITPLLISKALKSTIYDVNLALERIQIIVLLAELDIQVYDFVSSEFLDEAYFSEEIIALEELGVSLPEIDIVVIAQKLRIPVQEIKDSVSRLESFAPGLFGNW